MRFSIHQTLVLGASLIALPAIAALIPSSNNDLGHVQEKRFLEAVENKINEFENLKATAEEAAHGAFLPPPPSKRFLEAVENKINEFENLKATAEEAAHGAFLPPPPSKRFLDGVENKINEYENLKTTAGEAADGAFLPPPPSN